MNDTVPVPLRQRVVAAALAARPAVAAGERGAGRRRAARWRVAAAVAAALAATTAPLWSPRIAGGDASSILDGGFAASARELLERAARNLMP